MISKYLKQLYIGVYILNENLNTINNIWKTEIENNNGYVSDRLKSLIMDSNTIVNSILKDLDKQHITYSMNEAEKLIKEVYDFMFINNSSRKIKNKEAMGYDFVWEKSQLPNKLLDATITCSYMLNYIMNKLKVTVEKHNYIDKMTVLFTNIKEYVNFTEEELILNKYKIN